MAAAMVIMIVNLILHGANWLYFPTETENVKLCTSGSFAVCLGVCLDLGVTPDL